MLLSEAIKELQEALGQYGDVHCNEIDVDATQTYDSKTDTYGHYVTIGS